VTRACRSRGMRSGCRSACSPSQKESALGALEIELVEHGQRPFSIRPSIKSVRYNFPAIRRAPTIPVSRRHGDRIRSTAELG